MKGLLAVCFCLLHLIVFAQQQTVEKKKILIIPYNPMMHLSDADGKIAEESEKEMREIRTMFRSGIDQQVNKQLLKMYESHDILADMRPESRKNLEMIYGSVNYSYDTVYAVTHPKLDTTSLVKRLTLRQQVRKEIDRRNKTNDLKYMNAHVSHPELLKMLADKYHVDYFLFLNQFEMKTDYGDCIDLAAGVYRRDIKIHYSIIRSDGEQLYGDVATMSFASDNNDVGDIMTKNFPPLSEQILAAMQ